MKILLTGATGFVGQQLTMRLLKDGHSVCALARNSKKAKDLYERVPTVWQSKFTVILGDVGKEQVVMEDEKRAAMKNEMDAVYHIAAYLSFDEQEKGKLDHVNVTGTRNILEFSKEIGVKNFFHVSTAYTLGEQSHADETLHSLDQSFVNEYEKSKCKAEHLIFEYRDFFNVNIFRPSIIVGDSQTGEAESTFALYGVIRSFKIMKKKLERGGPLEGDKVKFLCDYDEAQNIVPIDYVVNVLAAGLEGAESGAIYHITNSNPPTNGKVFEVLKEELEFHQVELVPTSYDGSLTDLEKRFNEPMKVFHKYLNKTVTFDDTNTQKLLKKKNLKVLDLGLKELHTIIRAKV